MDIDRGRSHRERQAEGFGSVAARDKALMRMFRGQRGKRAWKGAVTEFQNLAISRLKNQGRSEVIDTYWDYEARLRSSRLRLSTHIYSPGANLTQATATDIANGDLSTEGVVRQWKDGKLGRPALGK